MSATFLITIDLDRAQRHLRIAPQFLNEALTTGFPGRRTSHQLRAQPHTRCRTLRSLYLTPHTRDIAAGVVLRTHRRISHRQGFLSRILSSASAYLGKTSDWLLLYHPAPARGSGLRIGAGRTSSWDANQQPRTSEPRRMRVDRINQASPSWLFRRISRSRGGRGSV
jgi:hypothetical protein